MCLADCTAAVQLQLFTSVAAAMTWQLPIVQQLCCGQWHHHAKEEVPATVQRDGVERLAAVPSGYIYQRIPEQTATIS
jgi:hypothetical protein